MTLWAVAHKASLSVGFPRQEYWSELPFPFPGELFNPGIEAASLPSPALAGGFFNHYLGNPLLSVKSGDENGEHLTDLIVGCCYSVIKI